MKRKGDWMQTYTGRQFWPIDPRPEEIFIEDIAHALSLQCRFGGHVRVFYSVGEHSLRVSDCFQEPRLALWGLLHDAAEAYLVDLPRPIKRFSKLGAEYRLVEQRVMAAVCERFNLLPLEEPPGVKSADDYIMFWEQRDLMAPPPVPWALQPTEPLPRGILTPMSPQNAEQAFLKRFYELKSLTKATE